jgi:hypothetical protein
LNSNTNDIKDKKFKLQIQGCNKIAINNQMQTQTTQHKTLKPQAKFHNEQLNSYATLKKDW